MPYQYNTERQDYSDYASGRVFYNSPGQSALPVRLASEIFQRCLALYRAGGNTGPCTIYDPCCGGAYHLSTMAYRHWQDINTIIGSDIDESALALAQKNLSLLTAEGINRRISEIETMLAAYGKNSHAEALKSAQGFKRQQYALARSHPIQTFLFQADATDAQNLRQNLKGQAIDIVFADIPYGWHSSWQNQQDLPDDFPGPVWQMLEALETILKPDTFVVVIADKGQKIIHAGFTRQERFRLGKRQIVLLKPVSGGLHAD